MRLANIITFSSHLYHGIVRYHSYERQLYATADIFHRFFRLEVQLIG